MSMLLPTSCICTSDSGHYNVFPHLKIKHKWQVWNFQLFHKVGCGVTCYLILEKLNGANEPWSWNLNYESTWDLEFGILDLQIQNLVFTSCKLSTWSSSNSKAFLENTLHKSMILQTIYKKTTKTLMVINENNNDLFLALV